VRSQLYDDAAFTEIAVRVPVHPFALVVSPYHGRLVGVDHFRPPETAREVKRSALVLSSSEELMESPNSRHPGTSCRSATRSGVVIVAANSGGRKIFGLVTLDVRFR
jgi:hypothetical protein